MSNIFEDHPAKSIISYTIFIIGVTWAVSTFILEDRKLSDMKSQLESEKAISSQYKVKMEILQKDMEKLQAENTEYKLWLEKEGKVVPSIFVTNKLEMEEEIKNLKSRLKNSSIDPEANLVLRKGEAYINKELDLSIALDDVSVDNAANIYLKLPNSNENIRREGIKPGDVIPFKKDNKEYKIIFKTILFINDVVEFIIDPVV